MSVRRERTLPSIVGLLACLVCCAAGVALILGPLTALPFGTSRWDSPVTVLVGVIVLVCFGAVGVPVLVSRLRHDRRAVASQLASVDSPGVGRRVRPHPPEHSRVGDRIVLRGSRGAMVAALLGALAFVALCAWIGVGMLGGWLPVDSPAEIVTGSVIAPVGIVFFGALGIPVLLRRIRHAHEAIVWDATGVSIEGRRAVPWNDVHMVQSGINELLLLVAPAAYEADLRSRWLLDRWMQRANHPFRGSALALPRIPGVSSAELAQWIATARDAHLGISTGTARR